MDFFMIILDFIYNIIILSGAMRRTAGASTNCPYVNPKLMQFSDFQTSYADTSFSP